eukprot:scaffold7889_cov44-Cyclotella_meneghiniana.AAC.3
MVLNPRSRHQQRPRFLTSLSANWLFIFWPCIGAVFLLQNRMGQEMSSLTQKGQHEEHGEWNSFRGYGEKCAYVCDSFAGLPPDDRSLDKADLNWDNTPYLEVSSETVASSFNKFGLLDNNVIFVKGFFVDSIPPILSKHIDKLSIMRLDVSKH